MLYFLLFYSFPRVTLESELGFPLPLSVSLDYFFIRDQSRYRLFFLTFSPSTFLLLKDQILAPEFLSFLLRLTCQILLGLKS